MHETWEIPEVLPLAEVAKVSAPLQEVCEAPAILTTSPGPVGTRSSPRPLLFWDYATLGIYSVLVGWIISKHEAWADEAQAWLIARDSSLIDLFAKRLHYEGTPGLWHFCLWSMQRLHVSYEGMHWIAGMLGVAGVYVLLRYSPFPPLIRRLIPFGFGLLYQPAVVARSYSLVPLLLFALCALITGRRYRPMAFAVVAGLLANTSAPCVFLATAMVPVYRWRWQRHRPASIALPGTVLAGFLFFACYTALPAPDVTFGIGAELAANKPVAEVLGWVTRTPVPSPQSPQQTRRVADDRTWQTILLERIVWSSFLVASLACFVVSSSNLLAAGFYGVLLVWLSRHKVSIAVLPLATMLCAGCALGVTAHQFSILWCSVLAMLWVAWGPASTTVMPRLDTALRIVLVAVLIEQAGWMAHAAFYDIRGPFDGGLAAYRLLQSEPRKENAAMISYNAESLQPYSGPSLFFNQSTSYYPWRKNANPDDNLDELISRRPAFIFDSDSGAGDVMWIAQFKPFVATWDKIGNAQYLKAHNYQETHRFCGLQPIHFGFANVICQVIYEPVPVVSDATRESSAASPFRENVPWRRARH